MIKAALKKRGVNPDSVQPAGARVPAMRAALNNGQVDAVWTPEPFLSQILELTADASCMAPGPVLGRYWPIGGYGALNSWVQQNPQLAAKFRRGDQPLADATRRPTRTRSATCSRPRRGTCGFRSGARSSIARKLSQLARLHEAVRRHPDAAEPDRDGAEHRDGRQEPAGHRRQPVHRAASRRCRGDER